MIDRECMSYIVQQRRHPSWALEQGGARSLGKTERATSLRKVQRLKKVRVLGTRRPGLVKQGVDRIEGFLMPSVGQGADFGHIEKAPQAAKEVHPMLLNCEAAESEVRHMRLLGWFPGWMKP